MTFESEPKSPIFIGGLYKSGTTLLRAMLGQHSAIASGLETQWFNLQWDGTGDQAFVDHIHRLGRFYDLEKGQAEAMAAESRSVFQFLDRFLGHYARCQGKRRWLEKTPGNIIHMTRIFEGWPDARVLHVIRDPRDVFASLKQAGKWDTIDQFVEQWCLFFGSAERSKKELELTGERYLEIRYESLARYPKETMKRVLDFLGEAWEEGAGTFEGRHDDFQKVLEITGKASTTLDRLREPLSGKRIGIWTHIVSSEELERVHRKVEEYGLLPLMKHIEEESLKA